MRISRNAVQKAVAGVILGGGLAVAGTAQAAITYDLRLDNGSHSANVSAPGTYNLQLWVDVTGSDTNHANDGLKVIYAQVASQPGLQVGGGALVGGGGLANGTLLAPFNGTASSNGSAANLTADGVVDWGSTSANGADTNYMLARTDASPSTFGGGSIGDAVNANTWEFEIATFQVQINAVGAPGDSTTFRVQAPVATSSGLTPLQYAIYSLDNTSTTTTVYSNAVGTLFSAGQGVTFTSAVPEPASLSLLGLGAFGLLGRRRKRSKV